MIKKLHKKFILINMSLLTFVLFVILIILCFSNYQKYQADSNKILEDTLQNEHKSPNFNNLIPKIGNEIQKRPPEDRNPIFIITIDKEGEIQTLETKHLAISQEFAEEIVSLVLNSNKSKGLLRSLGIRYGIKELSDGFKIACLDYSHELASMKNLILISFLIFIGTITVFFFISLFLSKWALAPVEKAWQQQKQFIADASHELKTPLTVILANLGILSSHPEHTIEQQSRWLENTQTEANRMKKLLDNLLFLAKSDASPAAVVFSEFDLSDAVWSCSLPFESLAYEQEVLLEEEIASNILLVGNKEQIKQLIAILLDNACKYVNKKGKISIQLELKQDKISLKVTNTGNMIPTQDLEHIFERFYRSDKSRVRKEGGYGLGLAIAKTIVEQHHGKIKVTSSEEKGTIFLVLFPINVSSKE